MEGVCKMETKAKKKTEQSPQTDPQAPEPGTSTGNTNKSLFLEKVKQSNNAIQSGDFPLAVQLYSEAIALDPANHILYSNRSAAYVKLGDHDKGLQDAVKARQLNPTWAKAYYREGIALQCLGQEADALAAFASGLAQDPKNTQLLAGLVEAAMKSPLQEKLSPVYSQLQKMKLDQSPFVVISVIGQELLAAGCYGQSLTVLESALKIGTCSLKLRGSVFSALASAHWGHGNMDKAIACMQQDLTVAKSLGDQEGECRAHGNLGAAYFSKGNYKEALTNHRYQLILAMRLKDRQVAASGLSSLGHVYTAIGDYPNALASHKQCVLLMKQGSNKLQEAREIGNVGSVYLAMGEFERAVECHNEHLKIAKQLGDKIEETRAYSNLGSAHHYKRNFEEAIRYHKQVLSVSEELTDRTLEARAYAGLGHAARCMGDYGKAKYFHEKQLDNALQTKDKVAEGRACSNLGIVYQQLSEYDGALKLHKAHLNLAKDLQDRASQGRAYGNIGNAYSAMKQYDLAIRFHKQELAISKEVNDRHSEAATHGNLAVAYQALNVQEKASYHYNNHLRLSRELRETGSEARALSNLGNYYSSRGEFTRAIPYYEQYLILSQELQDVEGEGKACHKLGYAHYSLANFKEAIRYYEQDLSLAKDLQDKSSMCRAYCNLGLAHKALEDYDQALECQKYCLATAHMTKNLTAKFHALGNIGDVYLKLNDKTEAIQMFNQQLQLAKQFSDKRFEAKAYGSLGSAHRLLGQYDKALAFHTQELTIWQELSDLKGECRAHGNLGNVHMSLTNYTNACRCYEEQLDRSRDLKDSAIEAQAYGNLGITKMNMGQFEDAIGLFEQQLAMLEQVTGNHAMLDKGRAFGNLGDCYESLGDYEESVKCHEQYLTVAQSSNNLRDQDKAYRGLGNAHRAMGNLQQALVCFEKRLVVAHELDQPAAKGSAYGELGCLHSLLGNFEQAVSCLQHQLKMARDMNDRIGEGDAVCGLGGVYQQMGEYEKALEFHELDLKIAEETQNMACQCRAYGNLGLSHESLGNFKQAVRYQEQHLSLAAQMNDRGAKTLAYSSLGRVHHAIGNYVQAVQYLQQGLQIAEQLGRREDEAKIRHRLGLALWGQGDLEEAQHQLYKAAELFEMIRREAQVSNDYKLSLFDLQTASYQALQRVLVTLGRHEEALVVAERGRTRAFVDLLLERQNTGDSWYSSMDSTPVTTEHILEIVGKQKACVLYFSIAAGFLYSWLITPQDGIVKFHECSVNELENSSDPEDTQSLRSLNASTTSLLDQYVGHVRESLGVESHAPNLATSRLSLSRSTSFVMSETESEADDMWQQHLEELGERLNAENDRTGFLRMVNRNHVFNSSTYSLSSLFSFSGSLNGLGTSRLGSMRKGPSGSGRPPLSALYDLLIMPMEDVLPPNNGHSMTSRDLVLVLQGDLYLIPFSLLKGTQMSQCLYERFNVLVVPSIRALQASQALSKQNRYNPDCTGGVVIGNPKMPQSVVDQWQWSDLPAAEQECKMVAEMLGCRSITNAAASKENGIQQMQQAEVIHLATHVSWKLAAVVLAPGPGDFNSLQSPHKDGLNHSVEHHIDLNESQSDLSSNFDGPPLSDFLLTAADVLNVKISAKLVVLNSGHSDDRAGRINSDGVVGLTRTFLAAGAQCVLFCLWPVPELASRILLRTFYTCLLQGTKTSEALSQAMRSVQTTKQFSHPSNWGGWVLVGSDVKLSSKVALMGHSLCELLKTPTKSREAMRVVLHLVEKTLQRIQRGQRNAMYTTQQSIIKKVGDVMGWRDLLTSVGFRFEPETNGLPAAVFFPTSDPGDRLTQCSASLQALLALSVSTLTAVSKVLAHQEAGEALSSQVREATARSVQDPNAKIPVSVRLWRVPGCHEFLASIGFDLVDVGKDEVTIKAGKQANRRTMQFAVQALVALFDTQEAPRSLLLDSSSSMESLCSSGSATSTSNFSKGSSPPGSPTVRKRSIFNPAEVDKLPSAGRALGHPKMASSTMSLQVPMMQHFGTPSTSSSSRGSIRSMPDLSIQLSHQNMIRKKYCSSGSDTSQGDTPTPMDDHVPRSVPLDTQDSSNKDETSSVSSNPASEPPWPTRPRQSLFERGSSRGYFPQPQRVYSTSASDSDDNATVTKEDLSRSSQLRSSVASGSSTLTLKSTSSSSLRRNRIRGSAASSRSTASDRTLTNEPITKPNRRSSNGDKSAKNVDNEEKTSNVKAAIARFNRSCSQEKLSSVGGASSVNKEETSQARAAGCEGASASVLTVEEGINSSRGPAANGRTARRTDSDSSITSVSSSINSNGEPVAAGMDPTAVAQKVLAETQFERRALEEMQRMSIRKLQEKRLVEIQNRAAESAAVVASESENVTSSTTASPSPPAAPGPGLTVPANSPTTSMTSYASDSTGMESEKNSVPGTPRNVQDPDEHVSTHESDSTSLSTKPPFLSSSNSISSSTDTETSREIRHTGFTPPGTPPPRYPKRKAALKLLPKPPVPTKPKQVTFQDGTRLPDHEAAGVSDESSSSSVYGTYGRPPYRPTLPSGLVTSQPSVMTATDSDTSSPSFGGSSGRPSPFVRQINRNIPPRGYRLQNFSPPVTEAQATNDDPVPGPSNYVVNSVQSGSRLTMTSNASEYTLPSDTSDRQYGGIHSPETTVQDYSLSMSSPDASYTHPVFTTSANTTNSEMYEMHALSSTTGGLQWAGPQSPGVSSLDSNQPLTSPESHSRTESFEGEVASPVSHSQFVTTSNERVPPQETSLASYSGSLLNAHIDGSTEHAAVEQRFSSAGVSSAGSGQYQGQPLPYSRSGNTDTSSRSFMSQPLVSRSVNGPVMTPTSATPRSFGTPSLSQESYSQVSQNTRSNGLVMNGVQSFNSTLPMGKAPSVPNGPVADIGSRNGSSGSHSSMMRPPTLYTHESMENRSSSPSSTIVSQYSSGSSVRTVIQTPQHYGRDHRPPPPYSARNTGAMTSSSHVSHSNPPAYQHADINTRVNSVPYEHSSSSAHYEESSNTCHGQPADKGPYKQSPNNGSYEQSSNSVAYQRSSNNAPYDQCVNNAFYDRTTNANAAPYERSAKVNHTSAAPKSFPSFHNVHQIQREAGDGCDEVTPTANNCRPSHLVDTVSNNPSLDTQTADSFDRSHASSWQSKRPPGGANVPCDQSHDLQGQVTSGQSEHLSKPPVPVRGLSYNEILKNTTTAALEMDEYVTRQGRDMNGPNLVESQASSGSHSPNSQQRGTLLALGSSRSNRPVQMYRVDNNRRLITKDNTLQSSKC